MALYTAYAKIWSHRVVQPDDAAVVRPSFLRTFRYVSMCSVHKLMVQSDLGWPRVLRLCGIDRNVDSTGHPQVISSNMRIHIGAFLAFWSIITTYFHVGYASNNLDDFGEIDRIYKGWHLNAHEFPWMVKIKVSQFVFISYYHSSNTSNSKLAYSQK